MSFFSSFSQIFFSRQKKNHLRELFFMDFHNFAFVFFTPLYLEIHTKNCLEKTHQTCFHVTSIQVALLIFSYDASGF